LIKNLEQYFVVIDESGLWRIQDLKISLKMIMYARLEELVQEKVDKVAIFVQSKIRQRIVQRRFHLFINLFIY